jgi:hypothetical protein
MTTKCCICLSNKGTILKLSCCDRSFVHEACIKINMRLNTNKCPECKNDVQYSTNIVRRCKFWKVLYSILWRILFLLSLICFIIMIVCFYDIKLEYKRKDMYNDIVLSLGLGVVIRLAMCILIVVLAGTKKYLNRGMILALCLIVCDITYYSLYERGKLKTNKNIGWNYMYVLISVIGVNLLALIGSNVIPFFRCIKDSFISCLLGIKRSCFNCLRFSFCYETTEVHTNHIRLEKV